MKNLKMNELVEIFQLMSEEFKDNMRNLSLLDSHLGDGDHGVSMERGFNAVASKIGEQEFSDISDIFNFVGKTLMKSIGGSCGPLFATFFIKGSLEVSGKKAAGVSELYSIMKRGLDEVVKMGKACPGDKTMVDTLIPLTNSLYNSMEKDLQLEKAVAIAAKEAKKGSESTISMVAKKGRGRYQGAASAGFKDPGAESVFIIINTFNKYLNS